LPALANETGTITLLHGPDYQSNVLLPVIGPERPAAAAVKGAKGKAKKRASVKKTAEAKRRNKRAARRR
jgi:hypothetical protein